MSATTPSPNPAAEGATDENPRPAVTCEQVRVVRTGHGANCSSIGSVVDTLFATAAVGAAVFAAVVAALKREDVHVRRPAVGKGADGSKAP
jgi:hypothetical protein